nr:hypothetical protein [Clostridium cavendishii]
MKKITIINAMINPFNILDFKLFLSSTKLIIGKSITNELKEPI